MLPVAMEHCNTQGDASGVQATLATILDVTFVVCVAAAEMLVFVMIRLTTAINMTTWTLTFHSHEDVGMPFEFFDSQ